MKTKQMPDKKEYDTLATRLSQMLIMFNDGKRLSVEDLSVEFGVSKELCKETLIDSLTCLLKKKMVTIL